MFKLRVVLASLVIVTCWITENALAQMQNTVIPGPLYEQHRVPDNDYKACQRLCEGDSKCKAWVYGPSPLPAHVKYNCSLKSTVMEGTIVQANVVSGYASNAAPNRLTCAEAGGVKMEKGCWFLGAQGASCKETCEQRGQALGVNGSVGMATKNYAGSAGTDAACQQVMAKLGVTWSLFTPVTHITREWGCAYLESKNRLNRYTTPGETTAGAKAGVLRRACACREADGGGTELP